MKRSAVAAAIALAMAVLNPAWAAETQQATVITGPVGTGTTIQVEPGHRVRLSDIDFGATYQGPPRGVFIRPLAHANARPGDPSTFFAFFANPPTSIQTYFATGEEAASAPSLEDQYLPAGAYTVQLLGQGSGRVTLPGAGARRRSVTTTRRFQQRYVSGDVPGAASAVGWSGLSDDHYDLRRGAIVLATAVYQADVVDYGEYHQCPLELTRDRCPSAGPTGRGLETSGRGSSWLLNPRTDPVRGHVVTSYDGLHAPARLWRSFLSFDRLSAGR
jgi:hypothetical protein